MARYDHGPFEPLEVQLGGRAAFEAHQKAEAERTARFLAHRRKARRETLAKLMIIPAVALAIYVIALMLTP